METTIPVTRSRKMGLLLLAYIAFISLGLPDGLLGVAWPSIRATFGLPLDALGLLLIASTSGYLTSSFFSGTLMKKLGVGGLLAVSCFFTGASLLGYTLAPGYWLIIFLGIFAGLGAGAIDAGINTYIASEHSEGLMQWLHASFGIGITLGPIIMTAGLNIFESWRWGYVVVGAAQVTLALIFGLTRRLWKRDSLPNEADTSKEDAADADRKLMDFQTPMQETMRQPRVWLSVALFFLYTGVELTLGIWAYSLLTEGRGIAPQVAGLVAGSYWGMFTVGRILAGLYTHRVKTETIVRFSIIGALIGALLVWWNPSAMVSLIGVALTGFAVAPIFPGLMSDTASRVGSHHAANTIGMQISGAGLGAMALPGLAGVLADSISLEVIPVYLSTAITLLLVLYVASHKKVN